VSQAAAHLLHDLVDRLAVVTDVGERHLVGLLRQLLDGLVDAPLQVLAHAAGGGGWGMRGGVRKHRVESVRREEDDASIY